MKQKPAGGLRQLGFGARDFASWIGCSQSAKAVNPPCRAHLGAAPPHQIDQQGQHAHHKQDDQRHEADEAAEEVKQISRVGEIVKSFC